eukprot:1194119-Amphidinium_carterae.1
MKCVNFELRFGVVGAAQGGGGGVCVSEENLRNGIILSSKYIRLWASLALLPHGCFLQALSQY